VRTFLNSRGDAAPRGEQHEDQGEDLNTARSHTSEQEERLESKRQEIRRIRQEIRRLRNETHIAEQEKFIERRRTKKRVQQEIFELERELRATKEGVAGESQTGALPDFVVIGAMKGGTTFLYYLLAQHPLVQPAASKELHFFDHFFDEGIEWYRRCFPAPRWEDGRRTITGEASPYMAHHLAPERMAQVVPGVRLIALLRDPVERAYSHYQQWARKGKESRTFAEAIEAHDDDSRREYLSKGLYMDQLLRWSEYFSREQMLVLKSEDFFEKPKETLKLVLDFLDLPEWEPEASELESRRNAGRYEQEMDPAIRRRLEEYFEPHNKRLYDYLDVDFGW
jgi:hypothetical protein